MNGGPLDSTIAVVTGASRGAGRAIAAALGEHGATVYVTGRSTGGERTEGLAGTVEDTALLVTGRGGEGVAVRCDHTDDGQTRALFDRVRAERGRLDLLVNNVWGGYEHYDGAAFVAPLWEQPLSRWDAMFTSGLRAHIVASRFAAPLLIAAGRGLLVNTTAWDRGLYLGNLYYDIAKNGVCRLAFALAQELRDSQVAAVTVAPGFMRTERVLAAGVRPDDPRTESPEYVGRGIRALAADPLVMRFTGQTLMAGELAKIYGFTDVDGRRVPPFRIDGKPEPDDT